MKKISHLLGKILLNQIKISFKDLKQFPLVIYNSYSKPYLKFLIKDYDFTVLDLTVNQIKVLNLSPGFIFKLISNYVKLKKEFNFTLGIIYALTFLEKVNPKVVLTSCDNHRAFSILARFFHGKIKFLAIQNANRNDFEIINYKIKKKIIKNNTSKEYFFPHFFCFSNYEKFSYEKNKIEVKNFYSYGSINTANFLAYIHENKIKLNKSKYDICLISEPCVDENKEFLNDTIEEGFIKIVNYTIKFSKDNKKKLVFAIKRRKNINPDLYDSEIKFYRKYLDQNDIRYLMNQINQNTHHFSSHLAMYQSQVAIGMQSTLLREKISVDEKILACHFSDFEIYNFPVNGICKLYDCDYSNFETRLKTILSLNSKEYLNQIKDDKSYLTQSNKNEEMIRNVQKKIDTFLI